MMTFRPGTLHHQVQNVKLKNELSFKKIPSDNRMSTLKSLVSAGKRLTHEEKEYLRKNHPELYSKVMMIEDELRSFKQSMHKARTKDEVKRLHLAKVGQFADEAMRISKYPGPSEAKSDRLFFTGARSAAISDAYIEFKYSAKYSRLPTEQELIEKERVKKALEEKSKERIRKLKRMRRV